MPTGEKGDAAVNASSFKANLVPPTLELSPGLTGLGSNGAWGFGNMCPNEQQTQNYRIKKKTDFRFDHISVDLPPLAVTCTFSICFSAALKAFWSLGAWAEGEARVFLRLHQGRCSCPSLKSVHLFVTSHTQPGGYSGSVIRLSWSSEALSRLRSCPWFLILSDLDEDAQFCPSDRSLLVLPAPVGLLQVRQPEGNDLHELSGAGALSLSDPDCPGSIPVWTVVVNALSVPGHASAARLTCTCSPASRVQMFTVPAGFSGVRSMLTVRRRLFQAAACVAVKANKRRDLKLKASSEHFCFCPKSFLSSESVTLLLLSRLRDHDVQRLVRLKGFPRLCAGAENQMDPSLPSFTVRLRSSPPPPSPLPPLPFLTNRKPADTEESPGLVERPVLPPWTHAASHGSLLIRPQRRYSSSLMPAGGLIMSAREKSKDSVSLLPCFYFVEMPILISSAVSLYFLEWTDIFRPVLVGFSCRDRSLSLPYIEPTHELIPLLMLLSLAFAGPAISIMVGEAVLFCCQSRRSRGAAAEANINAAGCNFNSFIRRAVRFIGVHTFGLCATALITNVLQLMTGNPTPYFLTVCKPNYSSLNTSCEQNPYIMEDICTGADQAAISQGRRSFPSQHATLASFAAVYVSMYFNSTLTDSSKLLKPLLVFSYTISAIVCGLTRIIQYKNHAVDVYLGFLLGSAIAVYLGLYAVGNFRPSKEVGRKLPTVLHYPPCSLPHISQEAILHHLKLKASLAGEAPAEVPLHQPQRVGKNVKHSTSDIEVISPRSAHNKDASVTFSHTLPRVHTPQAMAAYEEAARCHAATLHRASIDSSRSKQLLSQWKSKNHHNCSLQVPDFFSSSVDSSSGQSSHHPHHHGSMELRSSSEASAGGLNGSFDHNAYMSKLATGGSTTLPSNCSGITGGARILLQSRPGSSQLVHIPEEGHESNNSASPRLGSEGNEGSAAQMNWQGAAEKVLTCRTTDHSQNPQPRLMQMISVAKQQGLLQTHSKSLDETSINCNTSAGFQGSAHYKAQANKEPTSTQGLSSVGSTASLCGSTGAIVRVEAHPENKPAFHAPSSDATGSWRWRSLDHGTGVSVGMGSRGALVASGAGGGGSKQSFELNNLSRDSESSDSVSENSVDKIHANHISATATASIPPVSTVHTQNSGLSEQGCHQQSLSTIRVTPGDGSSSACGGGGDVASSCESMLQKKANNMALIAERTNSPEPTHNISYKATSIPPGFKD